MRSVSKDVGDKRRRGELNQNIKSLKRFSSIPHKKHLDDGQVAVISGSGQLVFRDGDKVFVITGVEN